MKKLKEVDEVHVREAFKVELQLTGSHDKAMVIVSNHFHIPEKKTREILGKLYQRGN